MLFEYYGNVHMHTTYSDGTGTFEDLVSAAHAAGIDFVYVTDHNVLVREQEEGYRKGVLTLVGQEVHNPNRDPERSHLLCLGIHENVAALAPQPQELIDAVREQQGLSFLAHPIEEPTKILPRHFSWEDWDVTGYTGVELWNYMSSFRRYSTSKPRSLLLAYFPNFFMTGPVPAMLRKWDQLTQERPVVAIGGTDVHAFKLKVGLLRRCFLPYAHCARALNTHILVQEPFLGANGNGRANGEAVAHDRSLVLDAMRHGHCWIGYDLIAPTRGFRFAAWQSASPAKPHADSEPDAIMGDTLERPAPEKTTHFWVQTPKAGEIRLLRNGKVIATARGNELCHDQADSGVYRVEVWREGWGKPRGWIFSNPIYVR